MAGEVSTPFAESNRERKQIVGPKTTHRGTGKAEPTLQSDLCCRVRYSEQPGEFHQLRNQRIQAPPGQESGLQWIEPLRRLAGKRRESRDHRGTTRLF